MKSSFITLLLLLLGWGLWAQVPQGINYQAIAWDANGPVVNQPVDVRMTLFDGANPSPLYQEIHVVLTNDYGLFTLVIGNGTPVSGTFAGIAWGNVQAVAQTEIDLGNGWVNLGSADLQSVPYALHAQGVEPFPLDDLQDVNAPAPTSGEVLKWNGSEWISGPDNGTAYTAGAGIDLAGNVITNTGDTDSSDDLNVGDVAGGDLDGFYPNPIVIGIQGRSVSSNAPTTGQVLKWDGTQWIPAADNGTAYTAGAGIDLAGNVITNTGDTDPSDDLNVGDAAGGDLAGTYPNPEVVGIRGTPILPTLPADGQVLVYSAATNAWTPDDVPTPVLVTDGSGNPRVVGGMNANGNGFLHIYDSTTTLRAGIQISGGQGELFGDVKNFRVPHPAQPEKEIWYASLEGPEAAAYLRGTAELVDGKARIPFPEHFQQIAVEEGMTVLLTPLSGKSRGLAVEAKSLQGFEVVELMEGQGNYSFDWEVKCVRQGHEDFEVVRPAIRKP